MTEEQMATPLRYRGYRSEYVDVAVRDTQHLGIGIEYAVHPVEKVGCFILRFVVHGKDVKDTDFTYLNLREGAHFISEGDHATSIKGYRLNKVVIKVFHPGVHKNELGKYADKFGIWGPLTEWVTEQITAEGFTVTANVEQELRRLLVPETPDSAEVKSVLEFPDMSADKKSKKVGLKLVENPPADDEDDEDDDEEEKDWLN
jgi:hypothetical protein